LNGKKIGRAKCRKREWNTYENGRWQKNEEWCERGELNPYGLPHWIMKKNFSCL